MLIRTWRIVDVPGCHISSGRPGQVPRMLRQTLPSVTIQHGVSIHPFRIVERTDQRRGSG